MKSVRVFYIYFLVVTLLTEGPISFADGVTTANQTAPTIVVPKLIGVTTFDPNVTAAIQAAQAAQNAAQQQTALATVTSNMQGNVTNTINAQGKLTTGNAQNAITNTQNTIYNNVNYGAIYNKDDAATAEAALAAAKKNAPTTSKDVANITDSRVTSVMTNAVNSQSDKTKTETNPTGDKPSGKTGALDAANQSEKKSDTGSTVAMAVGTAFIVAGGVMVATLPTIPPGVVLIAMGGMELMQSAEDNGASNKAAGAALKISPGSLNLNRDNLNLQNLNNNLNLPNLGLDPNKLNLKSNLPNSNLSGLNNINNLNGLNNGGNQDGYNNSNGSTVGGGSNYGGGSNNGSGSNANGGGTNGGMGDGSTSLGNNSDGARINMDMANQKLSDALSKVGAKFDKTSQTVTLPNGQSFTLDNLRSGQMPNADLQKSYEQARGVAGKVADKEMSKLGIKGNSLLDGSGGSSGGRNIASVGGASRGLDGALGRLGSGGGAYGGGSVGGGDGGGSSGGSSGGRTGDENSDGSGAGGRGKMSKEDLEKARARAKKVAGLSTDYNGESIGVAQDDLFQMIHRQIENQDKLRTLIIDGIEKGH